MYWVLNCNTSICKIYEYKKPDHFVFLKEINHPENKLKNSELVSDKSGHYQAGPAHGAFSPDTEPKTVKVIEFLKEVARELDKGRNEQVYQNLIIVAAPHTSGMLKQQLNKHIDSLISNHIQKDMMHLNQQDFLHFIKENI